MFLKILLDSIFCVDFKAVMDAEVYAASLGLGIFRVTVIAFVVSSFFIVLSGGFPTIFYQAIGPDILETSNMLLFFSMVVFGGLGTFFGPVVGAFILVPLNNYLTPYGAWRLFAWGLAILFVVLRPRGSSGQGRTLTEGPKHTRAHRFSSSLDPYGFRNLDFLKAFTVSSGRSFASLRTLGPSEAPGGISPGISVAPA